MVAQHFIKNSAKKIYYIVSEDDVLKKLIFR